VRRRDEILDAILGVVGGDAQDPRRELGFAAVALDALEHGDEDLLGDVFGFAGRAHQTQNQVVDAVAVAADDLVEGIFVPLTRRPSRRRSPILI
jgi:hypothetical protein